MTLLLPGHDCYPGMNFTTSDWLQVSMLTLLEFCRLHHKYLGPWKHSGGFINCDIALDCVKIKSLIQNKHSMLLPTRQQHSSCYYVEGSSIPISI